MKSGLSYWQFDTEAEALAVQALCHEEHKGDNNNAAYFATTTALTPVWQPAGESFWVMRIPSGIIKKTSLITKMQMKSSNIRIVKSKKLWRPESEVV